MTIRFDDFDIEISARNIYTGKARRNKYDTQILLNRLSMWAGEAAKSYERDGYRGLAEGARKASDGIYSELFKQGVYDD